MRLNKKARIEISHVTSASGDSKVSLELDEEDVRKMQISAELAQAIYVERIKLLKDTIRQAIEAKLSVEQMVDLVRETYDEAVCKDVHDS